MASLTSRAVKEEKESAKARSPSALLVLVFIISVLVLAGIELIFFTVASMGLCFGFVLKTVLITQGCFIYC